MRHSTIDLTMNTYTDPRLLDVRDALDPPPLLPLGGGQAEGKRFRRPGRSGTSDKPSVRLHQLLTIRGQRCHIMAMSPTLAFRTSSP